LVSLNATFKDVDARVKPGHDEVPGGTRKGWSTWGKEADDYRPVGKPNVLPQRL